MGGTKHVGSEKDLAGQQQQRSTRVDAHLVWSQDLAGPVGHGCSADHGKNIELQLNCNYFLAHPGDPGYPGEGRAKA